MSYTVRAFTPTDETSWLHCRVLAFLRTAYFDDVSRAKPTTAAPGLDLVAADAAGRVVGIMDTSVEGDVATIDTVAVHPDHQRRGLGRELLEQTRDRAHELGAATLDAWTRDDPDTLSWYRAMGFTESDHYLHVYANHYRDPAEPGRAVAEARPGLRALMVFAHAGLADEERMRRQFTRVHVCRRFAMSL
ncbi:GNAT family N-acetyltransferase [Actinacidiphila sp. bgisy167]|uniref:GNAT family N-acetyltransferase n=1 Tax=Actinacidiphila sp. bgisy167 TaxID=3413797 RepID=UPI003D716030